MIIFLTIQRIIIYKIELNNDGKFFIKSVPTSLGLRFIRLWTCLIAILWKKMRGEKENN